MCVCKVGTLVVVFRFEGEKSGSLPLINENTFFFDLETGKYFYDPEIERLSMYSCHNSFSWSNK